SPAAMNSTRDLVRTAKLSGIPITILRADKDGFDTRFAREAGLTRFDVRRHGLPFFALDPEPENPDARLTPADLAQTIGDIFALDPQHVAAVRTALASMIAAHEHPTNGAPLPASRQLSADALLKVLAAKLKGDRRRRTVL